MLTSYREIMLNQNIRISGFRPYLASFSVRFRNVIHSFIILLPDISQWSTDPPQTSARFIVNTFLIGWILQLKFPTG